MSAKTVVRNVLLIVSVLVASPSAAEDVVLFSYFENNGNSGVYLAYSTDGRTFLPLNNGNVVFTPPQWPNNQVLTRDPSIVFQDGLFHMVWTSDWSGRVFGYASSPDLVSWSTPLQVTPFPVTLPTIDQPINTWAPEIHYDHVQGHFEIVFSSTTPRERDDGDGSTGSDYSNNDHRLYSVRTTDFVTFTPAAKVYDHDYSVIDGHVLFDDRETPTESDDRWIMAIKREQAVSQGGKNIRFMFNNPDRTAGWTTATAPVLGPGSPIRSSEHVEGPSMVRYNGEWLLYADAYTAGHYSLISSPDLVRWTDETASLTIPGSNIHHGTMFVVDRDLVGWRFGARSDLDDDGLLDPDDWLIFLAHHLADLSGLTPLERALAGDLDGDGDNDYYDFRLFRLDYIAAHGAGAFTALLGVPEPSAALLAALAATSSLLGCRRARPRR